MLRKYGLAFLCAVLFIAVLGAGTKEEIIQLQTDVLQLQSKINELQKSLDANSRKMNDLLIQIKDDVGATSTAVKEVRKQLAVQQGEMDATANDLGKKIGAIGQTLEETTQRLTVLADQVSKLRLKEEPQDPTKAGTAPPADKLWDTAYKDFLQGNFEMALQEFQQFVRYYPQTERGAEAQYYIGESLYNLKRFGDAIKAFDEVATSYPTSATNAPALFKSGLAYWEMENRDGAITRFRAVIEKFPDSPEAKLAAKRLDLLGVKATSPSKQKAAPPKSNTRRRS